MHARLYSLKITTVVAVLLSMMASGTLCAGQSDEVGRFGDDNSGDGRSASDTRLPHSAPVRPLSRPDKPAIPKPTPLTSIIIPPRHKSRTINSRSLRKMIRSHNKLGRPVGDIKLYAPENSWGRAVKIQDCYGDNILTKFSIADKGKLQATWFQFKDVTYRNKKRHRHRWVMVEPGMLIRGRTIYLRAQSPKGNGVISIKLIGNCIDPPQ